MLDNLYYIERKGLSILQPHLIVLDLDGTLLNDKKTINKITKDTLFRAKQAGHQVMIATGRPYRASELYYQELQLSTPIVNFNGAYIHHPHNPLWQPIHSPLHLSVVHDVVDSVHVLAYENLIAEVLDEVYVQTADDRLKELFNMGNPRITVGSLSNTLKENPTSLLIQAEDKNVPIIRKHLQDVHAELIEHRRWGAPFPVIEIVKRGLNKAVGIAHIAKEMQIPRERIIAFGDEDNDLEMLDYAGIGIAMGNAIPDLKKIATDITLTNNEDGIAKILIERLKL